ncbi:hypothetical protein FPHOBKDP_00028 [Listeria phage LPJP1]|nr:hypothetical protein FPHOBKDP_00028 [Listeria phage LPJP1]
MIIFIMLTILFSSLSILLSIRMNKLKRIESILDYFTEKNIIIEDEDNLYTHINKHSKKSYSIRLINNTTGDMTKYYIKFNKGNNIQYVLNIKLNEGNSKQPNN